MDELIAYLIIEDHPYEIDLNVSTIGIDIPKLIEDIDFEIKKEIGDEVEYKLIYAKYKRLRFINLQLHICFKYNYFEKEINEKRLELVRKIGFENTISVFDEIYEEMTKDFDNILRKYNFEKG